MSAIDSSKSSDVTIGSVGDLIGLWPSISDFALDLAVPYDTAKGMKRRNAVSSEYWVALIAAAERRGIVGPTFELLARLHARPSDPPAADKSEQVTS